MDVHEAVRTKRAVRQFSDKPLPREMIERIVNAGRRAQSAKNTQPWQFIVVTDRDLLEKLSKLGQYAGHLAGAALAVVILTPDPDQRFSIAFDAGQAAAYMQLEAWALGVGSVPATIYEPDKARELLGFPEDWETHIAFSFGYPAEPEALTQTPKKGGRQPLDEVLHWNKW